MGIGFGSFLLPSYDIDKTMEPMLVEQEREIIKRTIFPYNVLIHILFVLLDWIVAPEQIVYFLAIRILTSLFMVLLIPLSRVSTTIWQLNILSLILVALNSWAITSFIVLLGDPLHIYYVGHFLVCLGVLLFLWEKPGMRLLAIVINLGPYLVYLAYAVAISGSSFVNYEILAYAVSFAIMCFVLGTLLSYFRVQSIRNLILLEGRENDVLSIVEINRKAAHDLKAPVGALKMAKDNILSSDGALSDFLDNSISRIEEISSQIMGSAVLQKSTAVQRDKILEECSVREIRDSIQEVISAHLVWRERVSIDCEVDTELSIKGEIKQIIAGIEVLVSNAFEASKGADSVNLSIFDNEGILFVSVSSDGPKFSEIDFSKHLVKPGRSTKENGNGLGLYGTKKYLDKIDGYIFVEGSRPIVTVTIALGLVNPSI